MSDLNFSNFKVVDSSNTKTGGFSGGRAALAYNFRYSRFMSKKTHGKDNSKEPFEDSFFEVSEPLFNALGLNGLKGLVQIVSPDGVSYLSIVDNDNAVLLKTSKKNEGGEKGRKFKSTVIESALNTQGVIDITKVGEPQYLDLVLVEGSADQLLGGKIKNYGVYEVVKVATPTAEAKASVAEIASTPESTPQVEETTDEVAPVIPAEEVAETPEAVASASKADDDDF